MSVEGKSYEVKYCPERGENVGIEVTRGEDGELRRRCLCSGNCQEDSCQVYRTSGILLWK
ncbi:MAG: hypothetical protein ACOX64_03535 [Candidatus Merdivicinus sp.]